MPYRVELSEEAIHDLERIYRFIQRGESLAAERWFDRLQQTIHSLSESPMRCPMAPGSQDTRYLLYGSKPYICRIAFLINEDQQIVSVQNVLHHARPPLKK